jgi:PAS domain S-box-containing protein
VADSDNLMTALEEEPEARESKLDKQHLSVALGASAGGLEAHVLVTLHDVAEERSLGLALEAREAQLRAVWDAAADAIVALDERRLITDCNAAAEQLFGLPREQLLRQHIGRLAPGFPTGPTERRVELVVRSMQRGAVPVEIAVRAIQGATGPLVAVIADVSERKREQAEHLLALERFSRIAEHLEDAFYVVTAATGRSLYVSPGFATIYGRPLVVHEAEPWPRLAWVHQDDRHRVNEAAEAARDGLPFDVEYRVVRPNGEVRVVHERASLLSDGMRITGIVRDVTHERQMAEELRQAQRLEAMGTLASGVAHDFNNLLMGVGGCVQLALRRLDPADPACAYLRRAADAIVRGANLTKQILRIGDTRRVSEGQVVLDDIMFGSRELVQSLVGDAIVLTMSGRASEVRVVAEAGDIEQIIINLASNARDAMPSGGELAILTELDAEQVTLSVRDTGVGMSPTVKARVFEPFFTTKRVGKGTGLGLATVFALARRLGGSVALESTEGVGTTVSVILPIAKPTSQLPPPESRPACSGGETVLMVDDDPLVRLTVENHLHALGYRALVASNAEEAIGICEDETLTIDLMITDVMMPGMLGSELSHAVRSRNKRFPVLYMSAHPREELVRDGRIQADAHLLAKPFDAAALGEALTTALEEARWIPVGSGRRTLVVDNDPDVAEGLKELLELEQFEVEIAHDAERALALAGEFKPEIVLCDVELGHGLNGYELARLLKRERALAGTYFVALTGHSVAECRKQARGAGFARVLGKPLDAAKLRSLLAPRV